MYELWLVDTAISIVKTPELKTDFTRNLPFECLGCILAPSLPENPEKSIR